MIKLTDEELAQRWGVTTRTLRTWRTKGKGPAFVQLGERIVFYRQSDVEEYENTVTMLGRPNARAIIRRAACAFETLVDKAKTDKARTTLAKLGAELRSLI